MAMTTRYTVIDGEVIAEKRSGVRKQYVPDPLGSTVALLDNTQAQTDTFTYWPYGEEASRTGTTPTPFRFVGTLGYYRDSSAKTYVRARELDTQYGPIFNNCQPWVGRMLSCACGQGQRWGGTECVDTNDTLMPPKHRRRRRTGGTLM